MLRTSAMPGTSPAYCSMRSTIIGSTPSINRCQIRMAECLAINTMDTPIIRPIIGAHLPPGANLEQRYRFIAEKADHGGGGDPRDVLHRLAIDEPRDRLPQCVS